MRKKGYFKTADKEPIKIADPLRKCVGCGISFLQSRMVAAKGGGMCCKPCSERLAKVAVKDNVWKLADVHLRAAQQIMTDSRYLKKTCKHCFDRGYTGTNEHNEVVICVRCVDTAKATLAWKRYVTAHPVLHKQYKWAVLPEENTEHTEDKLSTEHAVETEEKKAFIESFIEETDALMKPRQINITDETIIKEDNHE